MMITVMILRRTGNEEEYETLCSFALRCPHDRNSIEVIVLVFLWLFITDMNEFTANTHIMRSVTEE